MLRIFKVKFKVVIRSDFEPQTLNSLVKPADSSDFQTYLVVQIAE